MNWRGLAAQGDYSGLKRLLNAELHSLQQEWTGLKPLDKIAIFKLMEPRAAMDFYHKLPFAEKYFLFGAFESGSIAPILEGLPPRAHALFHQLPEECYQEMLDAL